MPPKIITEVKENIKILVAEDDAWQRLNLLEILTFNNFDVTDVENGRQGRDELLKEESCFDLVLLDLMMPEMDGLELLCLIKGHEKLMHIPVIMMSSDGEEQSVATCLAHGALDYLIKPIRMNAVKGLEKYVQQSRSSTNKPTSAKTDSMTFTKEKLLGRGAAGTVELVRRSDGQLFALKTIPMYYMGPAEKKNAQNEISLLKVLNGPTIIKFIDSFIENDCIHILMEYAANGSLSDKIEESRKEGKKFSSEMILYWMAQMVMGILLIHSKNILHRDIKSQNVFLTEGDVVKLGDFGISKELATNDKFTATFIGTPYFMSPEVCKGEAYGQKADIWALGCLLYELTTLKRPYQHDDLTTLYKLIKEADFEPLPESTSPPIKMLVYSLLQKEPSKRPTIWDIANIKCIREQLNRFVKENNCAEYLNSLINVENKKPLQRKDTTKVEEKSIEETKVQKEQPKRNENLTFGEDILFQIGTTMTEKCTKYNVKKSFMKYESKAYKGSELKEFALENYMMNKEDGALKLMNDLMSLFILKPVNGNITEFTDGENDFYVFQEEIYDVSDNMMRIYQLEEKNELELSIEIIKLANDVLLENKFVDFVDYEEMRELKSYQKFLQTITKFQGVELFKINPKCFEPFLLNLLQIMQLHREFENMFTVSSNSLIWKVLRRIIPFLGTERPFSYKFKDTILTIDELKHGIIRGVKSWDSFNGFKKEDPKKSLIQDDLSPRVLCLFYEDFGIPWKLEEFNCENYFHLLESICTDYINMNIIFDDIEEEIILPKSFETYKQDFGPSSEDFLKFIASYLNNVDETDLLELFMTKRLKIIYSVPEPAEDEEENFN